MADGSTDRPRTLIDILDDDSLLNIFYHYRPTTSILEDDGDIDSNVDISAPDWEWKRERWWYKPAQVCQRWRHIILASSSYLGLSLVCASGTPVADMLEHSPPFPLIIDYLHLGDHIPREDEEGTRLALEHRDRVRRVRLQMWTPQLVKLIEAIDGSFPLLDYLYICPLTWPAVITIFPSTLRAPHLRHLVLHKSPFPFGSSLLVGLVSLAVECNISTDFGPTELLQQLSIMPHLETFRNTFHHALSNQHVERQLLRKPLSTHVTLPTLRWFGFGGPKAYIEAILPRITMPLLEITEIVLITSDLLELDSSILFTLRSVCKMENPKLCNVKITFNDAGVVAMIYPHKRTSIPTLRFRFPRSHLIEELESSVQVFDGIREVFAEVESLTLEDKIRYRYYKGYAAHTKPHWREFLKSFNKVQTLHVSGDGLIQWLSRSLQPHDGESVIELLPMLRVFSCPTNSYVGESCRSFISIRQNAGYPVTISHQ